jgi:hypothetical protein
MTLAGRLLPEAEAVDFRTKALKNLSRKGEDGA